MLIVLNCQLLKYRKRKLNLSVFSLISFIEISYVELKIKSDHVKTSLFSKYSVQILFGNVEETMYGRLSWEVRLAKGVFFFKE